MVPGSMLAWSMTADMRYPDHPRYRITGLPGVSFSMAYWPELCRYSTVFVPAQNISNHWALRYTCKVLGGVAIGALTISPPTWVPCRRPVWGWKHGNDGSDPHRTLTRNTIRHS